MKKQSSNEVETEVVAIDFDGVLHAYSKEWHDGTIYDEPVPGAKEAMQTLLDLGYEVLIWSTRCHDREVMGEHVSNQRDEMAEWLARHEIPYTRIHDEEGKPLCTLFVDDNCYRFDGNWASHLAQVLTLL